MTHFIVGHGPHVARPAAKLGQSGRRIGHRTARDQAWIAHDGLHRRCLGQIDQGHRPLDQPYPLQHVVCCRLEDIEQGRTDGDQVKIGIILTLFHPGRRCLIGVHGARTYSERGG